ncbi:MAG: hypothetical protein HC929_09390 [Leptolyngbyaceae cyanobacterium SM2_5_2]|nr:hypothetical protein [Leptolyngbyaceae cyanobacterium SM2_5_2]
MLSTPLDDDLDDELLATLRAYQHTYGWPTSEEQQRGLLQTLLRLTWQASGADLNPAQAARLLEQLWLASQNPSALAEAVANQAQRQLIQQAHDWHRQLQTQVSDVLAAYLQTYAPNLETTALGDIALRIIPLVVDREITREEVNGLLSQVIDSFDVEAALGLTSTRR